MANDPGLGISLQELLQQYLPFAKFVQTMEGVYIWEFVTTLNFDVQLFREFKGSSLWAKWVYLTCRYTTLVYVLLNMATTSMAKEINCKIISKGTIAALYLSITSASALIGIRVIAIWNKEIKLTAIIIICILVELVLNIRNVFEIDVAWAPGANICFYTNVKSSTANITAIFVCDVVLQISMLVGLLRIRSHHKVGIWNILWTQGLIWTTIALITEVPSIVFVYLNRTNIEDLFASIPAAFILSICAMRLYRSLYQYARDPPANVSRHVSQHRTTKRWKYRKNFGAALAAGDAHRLTELRVSS